MKAEDKAKGLVKKFSDQNKADTEIDGWEIPILSKRCALIAVEYAEKELMDYLLDIHELQNAEHKMREIQEVKQHLTQL